MKCKKIMMISALFFCGCGFKAPPTPIFPPYATGLEDEIKTREKSRKKDVDYSRADPAQDAAPVVKPE